MHCPDNYNAYCQHEAEQERALVKLPECSECGEKITDEECYEFNDELICPDCLNDYHKRQTDDFID